MSVYFGECLFVSFPCSMTMHFNYVEVSCYSCSQMLKVMYPIHFFVEKHFEDFYYICIWNYTVVNIYFGLFLASFVGESYALRFMAGYFESRFLCPVCNIASHFLEEILGCFIFCTRNWSRQRKRFAFTGYLIVFVMSFIAKRKNVTDNEDPWGITFVWIKMFDCAFGSVTENCLVFKKLMI